VADVLLGAGGQQVAGRVGAEVGGGGFGAWEPLLNKVGFPAADVVGVRDVPGVART
jgi:hypothetical protein